MSCGLGLTLLGWVPGFVAEDSMYTIAQLAFILGSESLSLCIDSDCKQWGCAKLGPKFRLVHF